MKARDESRRRVRRQVWLLVVLSLSFYVTYFLVKLPN